MTSTKIQTIFFDLGNLLFKVDQKDAWDYTKRFSKLNQTELYQRFYQCGDVIEHMIGSISNDEFFVRFGKQLEYNGHPQALKEAWSRVFKPIQARLDLVKQLSPDYQLGIISNISKVHSDYIEKEVSEMSLFQHKLYSWKTGYMKPRAEMFEHALSKSKMSAEKCLFLDDTMQHVEAARKLAWNAEQVSLHEDMASIIHKRLS